MNFNELNTNEQFEQFSAEQKTHPVLLFKHSTTCPISADVFSEVSRFNGEKYLLIVQSARPISNLIAEKTGIRHESPQALVFFNDRIIYHASHYDVTATDIQKAFDSVTG